jgi:guanylate kinase
VLSSPSGAGKTSICRGVVKLDPNVAYSVSATTRPRRPAEVHGRSYWFYSPRVFARKLRRGELLEHARVYDYWYGTPRRPVLSHFRQGRDVIADLDIQGMRSCRRALAGTVGIFVTAPSRGELARRLRGRATDSPATIARREAELGRELAAAAAFDYLVVNDRLSDAVRDVMAIIRAERLRPGRSPGAGLQMNPGPATPKRRTRRSSR